jgi:hypothetical protein
VANWINTYREGQIPAGGTINETTPGRSIARTITEIQQKAITNIDVKGDSRISAKSRVAGNTASITLQLNIDEVEFPEFRLVGFTGTINVLIAADAAPPGRDLRFFRRRLTLEDGVVKSVETIDNSVLQGSLVPTGGSLYQVLQRNAQGQAVWDWVRAG